VWPDGIFGFGLHPQTATLGGSVGPEPQKSDDIGASIHHVATAINQLTAQQKEFCNLLREILTQCLQSRAN